MSFYSYKNTHTDMGPGTIRADEGFRCLERLCVEVNKVFDACLQQDQITRVVTITSTTPATPAPVPPITFVSCRSTDVHGEIQNLIIDRFPDRPNFARVRANIVIPIEIVFVDSLNREFVATASITVPKDVILCVPTDALVPFEFESLVNAICVSGTFTGGGTFSLVVCVSILLKIVAEVVVLIPSYGFCPIPPCEEFAENVCDEFFRLPLFPQNTDCGINPSGTTT